MSHHLVGEGHLKEFCIYCKKELPAKNWKSDFHLGMHYKTLTCSCGKKLHIRVNFEGSGHDSWNGAGLMSKITKKSNIDDRIRVLEGAKVVERHYPKK